VEPISSKLLLWLLSFVSNEQESSSSKEREEPFKCMTTEIKWICLGKELRAKLSSKIDRQTHQVIGSK
jgi:hypothetical protein